MVSSACGVSGGLDAGAVGEGHVDGFALQDYGVRFDAMCEPYVAADDGVVAYGDASEDGGVGVDGHVVLDDGVARDIEEHAVVATREAFGSERDALVEHDV